MQRSPGTIGLDCNSRLFKIIFGTIRYYFTLFGIISYYWTLFDIMLILDTICDYFDTVCLLVWRGRERVRCEPRPGAWPSRDGGHVRVRVPSATSLACLLSCLSAGRVLGFFSPGPSVWPSVLAGCQVSDGSKRVGDKRVAENW